MNIHSRLVINTLLSLVILTWSVEPIIAKTTHADKGAAELVDKYQAGSQYWAYPIDDDNAPGLTPAPEGYVPFHIEHYGRHGSRWLHRKEMYRSPINALRQAHAKGKLTPRGAQLLAQLQHLQDLSHDRIGELTPLGHRQHRGIARRMAHNFPEVFSPGAHVDAKSTVVIRCILSMSNEVSELENLCPGITTAMDASRTTQRILAPNSSDTVATRLSEEAYIYSDEFAKRHSDHRAFACKVFADTAYAYKHIDMDKLFTDIFDIAVNYQSHDGDVPDIYDVFTPQELHDQWLCYNAWWYINSGNTSLTKNRVPYKQRTLLRNIIESADTAMLSERQSANLRFGHESIVLPLAVLMELNGTAYDTDDLETLSDNWRNYEVFMMASNIQMVFYRPSGSTDCSPDDVLVKVLLNEEEASLPLESVTGPYYRWGDVRKLYIDKLDGFAKRFWE